MSFLHIAYHFHDLASHAACSGQGDAARDFIEHAYTAAMMEEASGKIAFKIRPSQEMGHLASEEHASVRVTGAGVLFAASARLLDNSCLAYERLGLTGYLFSAVASRLGNTGCYEGIADIGDGTDLGDYSRICYSSGQPRNILVPDPFFFISRNYAGLRRFVATRSRPWSERKGTLFWRGTTTGRRTRTPGPDDDLYMDWSWLPRLHLCAAGRRSIHADKIDIALTQMDQIAEPYLKDAIRTAGLIKPMVSKETFADYKYLIDIDGYSNAWSLLEKMIMGATIFKVASPHGFRQWYYDRLTPWETHVPVASDLSDLDERMDWAMNNPRACAQIAEQAARVAADISFDAAISDAIAAASAGLTRVI
ncbi:glycosyl transferase family 90 [Telmatospirillum siberiense]|uniref:Glycosyl transferase CAP10 domain-containing protein n=1 Tax=Telmatospirillum siberiense TaxID=382514 RepID=A0A2N3PV02_9PROT|nr:glycosyl transferase family 90 [Telmatospirillum siberiense]PKU24232.1 hypothetical protein CWS72_12980 [Telmatospirillum siberiense]